MKRMLDLFSGLHGASAAFEADDRWEVISVDNNTDLEADYHLDLASNGAVEQMCHIGKIDLIWASPPCIEFYKCRASFYPDYYEKTPSLKLIRNTMDINQRPCRSNLGFGKYEIRMLLH